LEPTVSKGLGEALVVLTPASPARDFEAVFLLVFVIRFSLLSLALPFILYPMPEDCKLILKLRQAL
jgi:hypothetical protein